MKSMRQTAVDVACLLTGILLTTAGCASNGGGGGTTTMTTLDYTTAMVVAECERAVACCKPAEFSKTFIGYKAPTDLSGCIAHGAAVAKGAAAELDVAIAKKRMGFNAKQAVKCINAMKTLKCVDFKGGSFLSPYQSGRPKIPDCETVSEPLIDAGGACTGGSHYECKGGHCKVVDYADDGTCHLRPQLGDACAGDCVGHLVCANGKCAMGNSNRAFGDPCSANFNCESFVCEAKKCAEKKDKGADCVDPRQCKSSNCHNPTGVGKCVDARKVGDPCTSAFDCPSRDCHADKCADFPGYCIGK